ncbi:Fic family protein [Brevibacterium otitidis]|uniref:Fic family protein n=1 Tax=Brevibacterium otitidis TaxID=53364 RepID=A0ABV5X4P9_9MICO|nr:Fic family protein [Brevibacterium otitidis]
MAWNPEIPFDELPPVPSADVLETRRTLKSAITARAALAGLDQACRRIPNPAVLVNSLPYIEAQASSEIENIVTTTDELLRFSQVADVRARPATKEAYHYSRALFDGVEWIRDRPISAALAEQICTTIHQRQMSVRTLPGTRIANPQTEAVIYSPPEGFERITALLADWERFVNEPGELDPLIAMAAAHYQFEAIHPFTDGNGRTGRILNVLLVVTAGLLSHPVLYLSRYIIEHKDEYYRLLLNVTTEQNWEEWILFILAGVEETASATLRLVERIQQLQKDTLTAINDVTPAGPHARFADALFENPYCRISTVMEACSVSRPTAASWLRALADAGILAEERSGRDVLFRNTQLLAALTSDM